MSGDRYLNSKYFGLTTYEFEIFKKKHKEICNYTINEFEEFLEKNNITKFIKDRNDYSPQNCNRFGIKLLTQFEDPKIYHNVYPLNYPIPLAPIKIPKLSIYQIF